MARVVVETLVDAPPGRCFDLARSVDLHVDLARREHERAVGGTRSGLLELGDTVAWEARHFGLPLRLSVRITAFDRPRLFRDERIGGALRRLVHDHVFVEVEGKTRMQDRFDFSSWLPLIDSIILVQYFERLLRDRAQGIRHVAESDDWRSYVEPAEADY